MYNIIYILYTYTDIYIYVQKQLMLFYNTLRHDQCNFHIKKLNRFEQMKRNSFRAIFQIEESYIHPRVSLTMNYIGQPNLISPSRSFETSVARSALEYIRGISCEPRQVLPEPVFLRAEARGWVSSFSLMSRHGQRIDTNGLLPGAVFRPYRVTYFLSGSDTTILFLSPLHIKCEFATVHYHLYFQSYVSK